MNTESPYNWGEFKDGKRAIDTFLRLTNPPRAGPNHPCTSTVDYSRL